DVDRVLRQGLSRYIDEQLSPGPDPELDTRLSAFPTLGYSIGQVVALYNADQNTLGRILDELYAAKLVRAAHSRNQLQEVLVDFWFNHFNVFLNDNFD